MPRTAPASSPAKRFRAVLEPLRGNLGWVIARLPFDPGKAWKQMVRLRVIVEVGGRSFRTSLFAETGGTGYFILVNKAMQNAATAKIGTMVEFTISPDLAERTPAIPPGLEKIFKTEKALAKWFTKLSESTRYAICKWIDEARTADSRRKRVDQMAERLLLTMEGEKELPPILDVAFRRTPAARKGWDAMTPNQRRHLLMAIFYYQSPEARQRRVDKVIEEALRVAAR